MAEQAHGKEFMQPAAEIEMFAPLPITILTVIHLLAIVAAFQIVHLKYLVILLPLQWLTIGVGVSVGFHRSLAHKAVEFKKSIEAILIAFGSLALQGGPITWASTHRSHHQFSESVGDPHDASRGFFWAHFKWMLYQNPNGYSYFRGKHKSVDLTKNKTARFFEKHYLSFNLIVAALALGICLYFEITEIWWIAFPIRIVVSWHLTWLTNSYAHLGFRFWKKYNSETLVNSPTLAFLNFGEGWHLNHHDNQAAYKFGRGPFQFDFGYYLICVLQAAGAVKRSIKISSQSKSN